MFIPPRCPVPHCTAHSDPHSVEHGFWLHVDRNPEANLAPALDAWRRLKSYLKRALR